MAFIRSFGALGNPIRGRMATLLAALPLTLTMALVPCGLSACHGYRPSSYDGDGTMTAMPKGVNRYDVEFAPIRLDLPGRQMYSLQGLPSDGLLALLSLDNPSQDSLRQIEDMQIRVVMTLQEVGHQRASVKAGRLIGDWATTLESWNGQPVDFEGVWFRPRRHDAYTLVVDVWVDNPVENAAPITATPRVRGGGFGNP